MSIEKIIENKKKDIFQEADKRLFQTVQEVMRQIDVELEKIGEASKIILPINVLEILEKGGYVKVGKLQVKNDPSYLQLTKDGETVLHERLIEGEYRFTLLVEKIWEAT